MLTYLFTKYWFAQSIEFTLTYLFRKYWVALIRAQRSLFVLCIEDGGGASCIHSFLPPAAKKTGVFEFKINLVPYFSIRIEDGPNE